MAEVFDEHAPARSSANSLDHVNIGDDHPVVCSEERLLFLCEGREPSLALDDAVLAVLVNDVLSIRTHRLYLRKREFDDSEWVSARCQGSQNSGLLRWVPDGIQANEGVVA